MWFGLLAVKPCSTLSASSEGATTCGFRKANRGLPVSGSTNGTCCALVIALFSREVPHCVLSLPVLRAASPGSWPGGWE